jgi:hypothetical protein
MTPFLETSQSSKITLGELMKKKRKLVTTMKKSRKVLAKARAEKKRVNEEIMKLRKTADRISALPADQAQIEVAREIGRTTPCDIYPDDLEREFDKIERIHDKSDVDESQVMDANMGEDKPSKKGRKAKNDSDGNGSVVNVDEDEGVVDLRDDEPGDDQADLAGVGIGPDFGYEESSQDVDEANPHD